MRITASKQGSTSESRAEGASRIGAWPLLFSQLCLGLIAVWFVVLQSEWRASFGKGGRPICRTHGHQSLDDLILFLSLSLYRCLNLLIESIDIPEEGFVRALAMMNVGSLFTVFFFKLLSLTRDLSINPEEHLLL